MKILLFSHCFAPSVGGIETCSKDLAKAFLAAGHEVIVLTKTPSRDSQDDLGLRVIRRPSLSHLWQAVRWCDVFFQNNISLKTLWPLAFLRRPWVVATHIWIQRPDGTPSIQDRLKRLLLGKATNVYVSKAIACHIGYAGTVIPNPYDNSTFRLPPAQNFNRNGFIFVGRLVSDKGVDILLQAFHRYRNSCPQPCRLTIVGRGPEEGRLRTMAAELCLDQEVRFLGMITGNALVETLWQHRVLVVPSQWAEPFGLVALEGIACGCLVVGSDQGGLPEAIGNAGITFRSGDIPDLAAKMQIAMTDENLSTRLRGNAQDHLAKHLVDNVAAEYLALFRLAVSATT